MQNQQEDYHWKIGQKIRIARKRKGLSQAEFARRIGASQQIVSMAENGKNPLRLDLLYKIADVCDVSIESLIQESEISSQILNLMSQLEPDFHQVVISLIENLLKSTKKVDIIQTSFER